MAWLLVYPIGPNASDGYVAEGYGLASALLPSWTLMQGGVTVTNMNLNFSPGGGDYGAVFDSLGVNFLSAPWKIPPEGNYELVLRFSHSTPYELTQLGQIPVNARFLSYHWIGDAFEVRMGDELLQLLA